MSFSSCVSNLLFVNIQIVQCSLCFIGSSFGTFLALARAKTSGELKDPSIADIGESRISVTLLPQYLCTTDRIFHYSLMDDSGSDLVSLYLEYLQSRDVNSSDPAPSLLHMLSGTAKWKFIPPAVCAVENGKSMVCVPLLGGRLSSNLPLLGFQRSPCRSLEHNYMFAKAHGRATPMS